MKKDLFLFAVLLVSAFGFATTSINNFTGYNNYYEPLGNLVTFGELFIVPQGDDILNSISFYTGEPAEMNDGPIVLGAYVATWDSIGDHAGTLLYSSDKYTYDNQGNEELTFNTNGTRLTPGQQYVMFLSTAQYANQSTGQTFVPSGSRSDYLAGFVEIFDGGDFDSLFSTRWGGPDEPDWAVDIELDSSTPEPSSLIMLGTGLVGGLGIMRRKLL